MTHENAEYFDKRKETHTCTHLIQKDTKSGYRVKCNKKFSSRLALVDHTSLHVKNYKSLDNNQNTKTSRAVKERMQKYMSSRECLYFCMFCTYSSRSNEDKNAHEKFQHLEVRDHKSDASSVAMD